VPIVADVDPDTWTIDVDAIRNAITPRTRAILIGYPNNPTANLWDDAVLEKIILAAGAQGGLVVLDEAYQPFSSKSYIDRLARHRHVLLMRTLSKFGLAGVRLGYLMGTRELIAEIDKVRPPYNVSVLNCECALFALEHQDVFAAQALDLRAQRAILLEALVDFPGVRAYPSDANMILVRVADAQKTFEGMKARKVLVKNVSKMHPLLANCLRLTVGTVEENRLMLTALQESL
jgi:histidinol-phosphate aminotransferase